MVKDWGDEGFPHHVVLIIRVPCRFALAGGNHLQAPTHRKTREPGQ